MFADGSEEQIDTVIFATGYDYRIPFVEDSLFEWRQGHPQLYLNVFNRAVDSLYVLGFIEFADAAYHRFDEMAQLIAIDLTATGAAKQRFAELKATTTRTCAAGWSTWTARGTRTTSRRTPTSTCSPR